MPTYIFFPRSWHDHWGGHLLSIVPVKADGDLKIRAARWLKTLFLRWIRLDIWNKDSYSMHTTIIVNITFDWYIP